MSHWKEVTGGVLIGLGVCLWAPGFIVWGADHLLEPALALVILGSFVFMAIHNNRARDDWNEDQL